MAVDEVADGVERVLELFERHPLVLFVAVPLPRDEVLDGTVVVTSRVDDLFKLVLDVVID